MRTRAHRLCGEGARPRSLSAEELDRDRDSACEARGADVAYAAPPAATLGERRGRCAQTGSAPRSQFSAVGRPKRSEPLDPERRGARSETPSPRAG